VLERREIGTTAWRTIMMDEDLYRLYQSKGSGTVSGYNTELYNELWGGSTEPILYHTDSSDFSTFDSYIGTSIYGTDKDQTLSLKKDSTGTYTKSVSFTYYPGGAIRQGYEYRMKALLFLKDASTKKMKTLVSLDASNGNKRYKDASSKWSQYSYSDNNTLFAVTNMSVSNEGTDGADNHKLSVTVSRRSYSTLTQAGLVDGYYYIRLAKKENGSWKVVSDPKYYGTTIAGYPANDYRICYKAFPMTASSYTLTFENLDPESEYRLQFYGIADTDFDNYVNITDTSGTPLAANDTGGSSIFTSSNPGASTESMANNNYSSIYNRYIGIVSYRALSGYGASEHDTDFLSTEAYKVMLCASSSATTLKQGERTTLGTIGTINKDTDGKLTIQFNKTSGLGYITKCYAELLYDSDDGEITNLSSGIITITKSGNASIMDDGKTNGTVTLTIEDSTNDLLRWSSHTEGTYSLILYFYDSDESNAQPVIKYDSNDIMFY
jgi:hypothetical protein